MTAGTQYRTNMDSFIQQYGTQISYGTVTATDSDVQYGTQTLSYVWANMVAILSRVEKGDKWVQAGILTVGDWVAVIYGSNNAKTRDAIRVGTGSDKSRFYEIVDVENMSFQDVVVCKRLAIKEKAQEMPTP
jgi:hypothetical protein